MKGSKLPNRGWSPKEMLLGIPDHELTALAELTRSGVEYLLIGGYAIRHHGIDRETSDVDLCVSNDPANATRLLGAIHRIIGHSPSITVEQLSQPGNHVRFHNDGLNIDLLTSLPELDFREVFEKRDRACEKGVNLRPDLTPCITKALYCVSGPMAVIPVCRFTLDDSDCGVTRVPGSMTMIPDSSRWMGVR
jgi:hypothetical protein